MEFVWNGKPVTLVGDSSLASQSLSLYRILALVQKADIAEFFAITHSSPAPRSELDSMFPGDLPILFTDLLKRFVAIFAQPTGLPPHRSVDHRIHLIEGSKPVNVRPYRYPQFQKVEMEKLVKEMLDQGIITPSHGPFSSPVLLLRKKDGTWRFCVDYRALNAATIKDKFPIPTIDELLDELGGCYCVFQIGLTSGVPSDSCAQSRHVQNNISHT